MTEIVQSITEAFSMQPVCFYVGMNYNKSIVAIIALEKISIPVNGDPYEYQYYVGRDENGNKLFQYRAETVNVTFSTTK